MSVDFTARVADPQVYAHGDPPALWAELRTTRPVHWQQRGEGQGHWLLTRYADVAQVLRDHTYFTSERGTLLNLLGKGDPAAGQQLAATDPPRHDTLRLPYQRGLAARSVGGYEDTIGAGVRELLAPLTRGDRFDFAVAMSRLPLVALGPILRIPEEDHGRLIRLAEMATAEEDPEVQLAGGTSATLARAHRELFAYFADLVRDRAARPGDDLVSGLLAARPGGGQVSVASVVSNCYSMLLGSAGTLPHVATAAVVELASTPRYADWADHPDLLDTGIEEALRWASPASNFMRYARRDIRMSGVLIREGDAAVAHLAAANRDPEVFDRPEEFDVRRRPNRHLGFGVGHHYCVGANLARVVLRLLFTELFRTCEALECAGEVERFESTFLAGFKRVPVVARPRTDRAAG